MKTVTLYHPNTLGGLIGRPAVLSDFSRSLNAFFGESPLTPAKEPALPPAADIRDTENAYVVEMDLPGFDEKDIDISINGGKLSVATKKEEEKEEKKEEKKGDGEGNRETWILRERRARSFSRIFKLPENANPEEVTAGFKNGTLSLHINKRPEAKRRTIPINAK